MSCDYQSVLAAARCFECIPEGAQMGSQTYLLMQISGAPNDANALMNAARCIASCIPPGMLNEIKTNLLAEIVETTGGGIPVVTCTPDADAQAFITAAGLTDETQIGAVCQLVADLKAYPAVGTKYWDREFLIYPFVGGNATAHSKNLKAPLGTNNITWLGVPPPTHSAFGVKGNLATGYGNTSYLVPIGNLDNIRTMWYIYSQPTVASRVMFGGFGPAQSAPANLTDAGANAFRYYLHDNTQSIIILPRALGAHFIQRKEAANKQYAQKGSAWTNTATLSIGVANRYLYLFASNSSGGTPTGTPTLFADVGLSCFTLGTVLDATGGQAEKDEYKGIWDRFNTRLGRGNP